ncbi:MAG: magnesium transporter [Eubacteriales bacterium]
MTEQFTDFIATRNFPELKKILVEMNPADIAIYLDEVPSEMLPVVFRLLPKELAAETFVEMENDAQTLLIKSFSDKEIHDVMDELYADDAADIVDEMPANVVRRILANTDAQTRKTINELLRYPDDSAGSVMTVEFVDLNKAMTVTEAFAKIRRTGVDKETIYTCYVVDSSRHLEGIVSVKTLLLSAPEKIIGDIMETNVISVQTTDDQETVAQILNKYGLMAIPVVDSENRLVGIVTFDDAIDVIQEETTEDIEKMAAILPTDKPYLKTGVFETWRKRIPWLLLLMVSATFTGKIITSFESALAALPILTAFIPMLMDTGGNAGGQASVTIIRGLSLGEIELRDILRIIWKEVRVAFLCGTVLAAAGFVKLMVIDRTTIPVAIAVCLTLVFVVILAKIIGCTLPIAAKAVGFDPAVMASPFITTIVDALALLMYFLIAASILGL